MQTPHDGYSNAKIYQPQPNLGPVIVYGPQAPKVVPEQKLMFVIDTMDQNRGPALHFQTQYDKIVVLPPDALSAKKEKRDAEADPPTGSYKPHPPPPPPPPPPYGYPPPASPLEYNGPPPTFSAQSSSSTAAASPFAVLASSVASTTSNPSFNPLTVSSSSSPAAASSILQPLPSSDFGHRKNSVKPGDQPWFCYWNGTFIEGFIYVKQNTTSMSNSSNSMSPTSAPSSTGASGPTQSITTPSPNTLVATVTEQPTLSFSTSPTTTLPISVPNVRREKHSNEEDDFMEQFPYVMKIIERRLPQPNPQLQPYCQKMNVNTDGSISPVVDTKNKPIIMKIGESDPSESEFASAFKPKPTSTTSASGGKQRRWNDHTWENHIRLERREPHRLWGRNDPNNSCVCQWVAQ